MVVLEGFLRKKIVKSLRHQKNLLPLQTHLEKCLVCRDNAEIAQLVEHNLAKVGVASSSLVFRSFLEKHNFINEFILKIF